MRARFESGKFRQIADILPLYVNTLPVWRPQFGENYPWLKTAT